MTKKSCHDCIFLHVCKDQNKSPDGNYVCQDWEWKYQ